MVLYLFYLILRSDCRKVAYGKDIVIAGAGDMGYHLAEQLCYENKNIILIDLDKDVSGQYWFPIRCVTIEGVLGVNRNIEKGQYSPCGADAGGYYL